MKGKEEMRRRRANDKGKATTATKEGRETAAAERT